MSLLLYVVSLDNHKRPSHSRGEKQECEGMRATMAAIFGNSNLPQRDSCSGRRRYEKWPLSQEGWQPCLAKALRKGGRCHEKLGFSFYSLWPLSTLNISISVECVQSPGIYCTKIFTWIILFNPHNKPLSRYRWLKKFSNLLKYMWLERERSIPSPNLACYERYGMLWRWYVSPFFCSLHVLICSSR